MNGVRRLWWPAWLLMAFTPLLHADDTKPAAKKPAASAPPAAAKPVVTPADEELLEFLGSVDEESDG